MATREQVWIELDKQLNDHSPNGRIPRAIIGRWMQWLYYFGTDWLSGHLKDIFPDNDDGLRLAAWRAHILNDGGPVRPLLPSLLRLYMEEVARMARERESRDPQTVRDTEHRDNRFGEYVLIVYLGGGAPAELMQAFCAAARHLVFGLAPPTAGGQACGPRSRARICLLDNAASGGRRGHRQRALSQGARGDRELVPPR